MELSVWGGGWECSGYNLVFVVIARTDAMAAKRALGLARPHLLGRRAPPHPLGELVDGGGAINFFPRAFL